ncbi:MAG: ExbD/TolR family protein [Pirellulales bacterium]
MVDDELDMTPMIDVTFLLLIFFMVTAAFGIRKAIEVPLPEQGDVAQRRTLDDYVGNAIIVRLDGDNIFWISSPLWYEEREAPNRHDMLIAVRAASTPSSPSGGAVVPTTLLVVASGDATHENVVAALDAGSEVGMEDVQLATFDEDLL